MLAGREVLTCLTWWFIDGDSLIQTNDNSADTSLGLYPQRWTVCLVPESVCNCTRGVFGIVQLLG